MMPMISAQAERRAGKGSIVVKMVVIGLLILILLIPLVMVGSLVSEREQRRSAVAREVSSSWGNAQTLGGPVLAVPFHVYTQDEKGHVNVYQHLAYFLPEALKVDGRLEPEKRSRGIFDVMLYRADLRLAGTFKRPSFNAWDIPAKDVLWDQAYLAIGIPDMRGIRKGVTITWAGKVLQLSPGGAIEGLWASGLQVPISGLAAAAEGQTWDFGFDLVLNGSQELRVLPFGKQTTVSLRSPWPSPSFAGAFLPESHRVAKAGFEATWNAELPAAVAVGGDGEGGVRVRGGRLVLRRRPFPAGGRLPEDGALGEIRRSLHPPHLPDLLPL
jgi:inner membrane protein